MICSLRFNHESMKEPFLFMVSTNMDCLSGHLYKYLIYSMSSIYITSEEAFVKGELLWSYTDTLSIMGFDEFVFQEKQLFKVSLLFCRVSWSHSSQGWSISPRILWSLNAMYLPFLVSFEAAVKVEWLDLLGESSFWLFCSNFNA